jgi:hypothetical protein
MLSKTVGKKCVFIGHVITENGEVVPVDVAISSDLAKELAVVNTEMAMLKDKQVQAELDGIDVGPVENLDPANMTPQQTQDFIEYLKLREQQLARQRAAQQMGQIGGFAGVAGAYGTGTSAADPGVVGPAPKSLAGMVKEATKMEEAKEPENPSPVAMAKNYAKKMISGEKKLQKASFQIQQQPGPPWEVKP